MPQFNVDRLRRDMKFVTWDEFYFTLLSQISSRSNSEERRQGAILVKNNCIIATGCFDAYETEDKEKVIGSGAIENAIAYCAGNGSNTSGATLYTYAFPNDIVCKLLIKAGIKEVKCVKPNISVYGKKLCEDSNIKIIISKKE